MNRALILTTVAMLLCRIPAVSGQRKALTFRTASMGEIEDKEATKAGFRTKGWTEAHFGFTTFKASNGRGLLVMYDDFESREEARRFFDWKVGRAFRVLSRTVKTESTGNAVEYRAELMPAASNPDKEVLWVVGLSVHLISAAHLDDALELERWYRH